MEPKQRSLVPGIVLIVLGVVFLLPAVTDLRWSDIWPLLVFAPGLLFFGMYFMDRSNYGLLMPATVMVFSGALFFYCVAEGWHHMRHLWPLLMMSPGIGFILMYLLGKKEKGLLVPGIFLTGIGVFFLLAASEYDYLWPVILIVIGVYLLFSRKQSSEPTTPASS
jgi:hypothetical protein